MFLRCLSLVAVVVLLLPALAALSWVLTPTLREMEAEMAGPPDMEDDRWMIYRPK